MLDVILGIVDFPGDTQQIVRDMAVQDDLVYAILNTFSNDAAGLRGGRDDRIGFRA